MSSPRILIYDLEITPTLGWTYGQWDTNVIKVEREPYIMCFSYKWLGEEEIHCISQIDFKTAYKDDPYDDLKVVQKLWELLDEAHIVIAHNAARFDNRVAMERFLIHRLGPPAPYKTVDTLQVAKRYFKNGSNSLNNLCKKLGLGEKSDVKHGDVWLQCVGGCMDSWKSMIEYCKDDVMLLERLYLELRPYITNHPNVAYLAENPSGCPKCGSRNIQHRGYQKSNVATYQRVQCMDCKAWSRVRVQDNVPKRDKPDYVNISPSV